MRLENPPRRVFSMAFTGTLLLQRRWHGEQAGTLYSSRQSACSSEHRRFFLVGQDSYFNVYSSEDFLIR